MIKYQSYTKVTSRVKATFLFFLGFAVFQSIVVVGVGVALSCFKVKIPFIVAIKNPAGVGEREIESRGSARGK